MWRLAFLAVALAGCASNGPLRSDAPARAGTRAVDEHLPLAARYAPVIYHDMSETGGRQDIPAAMDFDGDWVGNNNWENFPDYELVPTVYYAVAATATHWFISYHIFHPRDWSPVDLGLQQTHENDGENLQVVVERATGEVVMLYTQAHYIGGVYVNDRTKIDDGVRKIRRGFEAEGDRVKVFVQSCGHGIYGEWARFGRGIVYRVGDEAGEPAPPHTGEATYVLSATPWPVASGDGTMFDGDVTYAGFTAPRYYDGDRYSGPLGNDRGISPYAMDFDFREGTLGALFFDPARRYAESLKIRGAWSTEYEFRPQ